MAKKPTAIVTQQPAAAAPFAVGLDIGYGVVKAVTQTQTVTFPSVAGHSRDIKFGADQIKAKYPGCQILDEDGQWFVGDLAASQIPTGELIRLRGRTANDNVTGNAFRVRMAKVALGMLMVGCYSGDREAISINIATGLPVDHMHGAAELKAALSGAHRIKTDSADFVVHVGGVRVMPQPNGTIYRQMLTSDGRINRQHTFVRTGVCDVGTYTVDVTLDDDGEYIDAESGSVESGVFTAHQRIEAAMEKDFGQKMPYKTIETTLRTGFATAFGEEIDYRRVVEDALHPLRSATLALLNDKFKAGASVDVLYLSGGGADLVFDDVLRAYPQTRKVTNPQLANAQGYLNFELYKQAQTS